MWTARVQELTDVRGLHLSLSFDGRPASVADVLHGWQNDAGFRSWFNALLADAPYTAFRWETPPVTAATLTQPFEFVLLDSPGLARRPDHSSFEEFFDNAADAVAVFPNLGGDALLVVPCPLAEPAAYGHLAAFVRSAPDAQRQSLWRAVGAANRAETRLAQHGGRRSAVAARPPRRSSEILRVHAL